VLSENEVQALRDIERRLRWESPGLVRLFGNGKPPSATIHTQRARIRVCLAAAALTGLALLGPSPLSEAEVRTRRRRPPPRSAPADTAIFERAEPLSGPAGPSAPIPVVDIFLYVPPVVATPRCRTT
jgi:hypothetical protein